MYTVPPAIPPPTPSRPRVGRPWFIATTGLSLLCLGLWGVDVARGSYASTFGLLPFLSVLAGLYSLLLVIRLLLAWRRPTPPQVGIELIYWMGTLPLLGWAGLRILFWDGLSGV